MRINGSAAASVAELHLLRQSFPLIS